MKPKFMLIAIAAVLLFVNTSFAKPTIGAQVWVEPGQTPEQIDSFFKMLADHNMPVARLFIMWNYIETKPGKWDFTLYDQAFDAASKHGVKVVATLTTNRRATHRGDFYQLHANAIEGTWKRLDESKIYIHKIVDHWKDHPALESWTLTNEAHQKPVTNEIAYDRFKEYLKDKYANIEQLNEAWSTSYKDFNSIEGHKSWSTGQGYWYWPAPFVDWHTFWREHLSWWLEWIATEVRTVDTKTPIHAHVSGQLENQATYALDLPAYKKFSDTIGGTFHPSWGLGAFDRDQFGLGVSYGCDLLAGSSGSKPFWMTELQGGTNIYSGVFPLTPTKNDIGQWMWTGLATGTDQLLFWLLNNRSHGFESGEWSMLDFQNKPTERLKAAGEIAKIIDENQRFFKNAKPVQAPVTIMLSQETMTIQAWREPGDWAGGQLGRKKDAHGLSAFACYETLHELGISARIKHMHDFDWKSETKQKQMVILPNVTAITVPQAKDIETFVKNGNTVLITGLTGMWDDYFKLMPMDNFPLEKVLGAKLKDVRLIEEPCEVSLQQPKVTLPSHLWIGEIDNLSAKVIGTQNDWVTATTNEFGKGKAIWIPSTIGLSAWEKDNAPLAKLLKEITKSFVTDMPFSFKGQSKNCLLRVMKSGDQYLTVVTNGVAEKRQCVLQNTTGMKPEIIWGKSSYRKSGSKGYKMKLGPRETIVMLWKKNEK